MTRIDDAHRARALLRQASALVVDADAITAFEIEQLLHDLGAAAVRIADAATQSIDALAGEGCSLAVVDIGAGGDAGRLGLLAALRARRVPHVAVTSCAPGDAPLAGLADTPVVFKPFSLVELTTAIETAARAAGVPSPG